jgi:hypothetical protein
LSAYFILFSLFLKVLMQPKVALTGKIMRRHPLVTDLDRKNREFVDVNESDLPPSEVTGRDVVTTLASSPLSDVQFDRLTIVSKVRDISL